MSTAFQTAPPTSRALIARDLCARTLDTGQPNPWQASEQDFVFFGPQPAMGEQVYTCSRSETGGDGGSLLTQIFELSGRLVAEGWTNSAAAVHPGQNTPATVLEPAADSVDELRGADLLAAHLDAAHGAQSLRRFRVRIGAPVASAAETSCSARELQRYTQNHEEVVDLALDCALADGTVVAQAWATVAV